MCTAIAFHGKDHYFGRNLDYEYSYQETVTITPRNYSFRFRKCGNLNTHYAIIGMAYVVDNYPLYYDGTNEAGLSVASLNFPENAVYQPERERSDNVTPYEVIPWILSQCATVQEAKVLIQRMNLVSIPFSAELLLTPLHWLIADRKEAITLEAEADGIHVYNNETGVLTNNPPFPYQMQNLNNYMNLSSKPPKNCFSQDIDFKMYSRGMGAIGLPGDLSSASRFVRACFVKSNSVCSDSEADSVSQFFHILKAVEQQRGCVDVGNGQYEMTIYSSCCNVDKGIYYYTTYGNSQITAVDLYKEALDGEELVSYPLVCSLNVNWQN